MTRPDVGALCGNVSSTLCDTKEIVCSNTPRSLLFVTRRKTMYLNWSDSDVIVSHNAKLYYAGAASLWLDFIKIMCFQVLKAMAA